jgi:hypothetical protein
MPPEGNTTPAAQAVTPEAYAALQGELDALRTQGTRQVEAATQPLKERIASLEADVKAKGEEITAHVATLSEKDKSFASLTQNHEAAITAYKGQVLKANPLVPVELITGANIQDIDLAVAKASAIVDKIKTGLAAQNQTVTIPAGAPGRTEPDISTLSTREKITRGLEAKRKK